MPTSRPSLNALRAFETSVRHASITRAADELCVTAGAVSRQVQSLEEFFSVPLLVRSGNSVTPTAEGARLSQTLAEGFKLINTGVAQMRRGPLTLSCSATIMMQWLIPRLGRFKELHPDVDLRLNVNYGDVDWQREAISVAIRNDKVPPPQNIVVKHLMREEIGVVCAPGLLERTGCSRLEDLPGQRLLWTKTRTEGWDDWWCAVGRPELMRAPDEEYEHFYLMIQAATCGLGFAMAPRMIVEDEIKAGRLVAPFGFVAGQHNILLWITPHLRSSRELKLLVDWITSVAHDAVA